MIIFLAKNKIDKKNSSSNSIKYTIKMLLLFWNKCAHLLDRKFMTNQTDSTKFNLVNKIFHYNEIDFTLEKVANTQYPNNFLVLS